MFRRVTSILTIAAVAVLAAFTPVSAAATILVDVEASPETITVGQTSTITATDLGGIDSVVFELDATPGGLLSSGGSSGATLEVAASGGTAQVEFSATEPGTFEIMVVEGSTTLAATAVVVSAPIESGPGAATLTATPESIGVGDSATVTAEGLGDLAEATFGLDGTPGGMLSHESTTATIVPVPVADGGAVAEFTATEPGIFTITVGDGETVLAMTTVTVDEALTTPSSTPSASPTSTDTEVDASGFPWILVGIAALVVIAGVVVAIVLVRRRKTA